VAVASPWYGVLLLSGEPASFSTEHAGRRSCSGAGCTSPLLVYFVVTLLTFDALGRATLPPSGLGLATTGGRHDDV
jgi:hypothetical protein